MVRHFLTVFASATFLLICQTLAAQAPEGIHYQAVARNATGDVMTNESLEVRMTIKESGPTGTAVYQETHNTTTNDFGLFNLVVGEGTTITGNFSNIDWGNSNHYLQVEVNPGSGFVNLGTTKFVSVPYALYAKQSGSGGGTTYTAGTGIDISGNTITNTAPDQTVTLTGSGATSVSGTYPNFTISSTDNNTTYSAGTGLNLSGTTFNNTGDTDASDDITNTTNATGDLKGTYPGPSVIALQGNQLDAQNPTNDDILQWNSGSNRWEAGSMPSGSSVWNESGSDIYFNGGNVGIGTNSPAALLHLQLPGTSISDGIRMSSSQGTLEDWYLFMPSSDNLVIRDDALNVMTFENGTGNIGLGTSNPTNSLSVDGYVDISNRLGINQPNPTEALDINGTIEIAEGNEAFDIDVNSNGQLEFRANTTTTTMVLDDDYPYAIGLGTNPTNYNIEIAGDSMLLDIDQAEDGIVFTSKYYLSQTRPAMVPTDGPAGFIGTEERPWYQTYSQAFYALSSTYYFSYSDQQIKENIRSIDNPLAMINSLNGITYDIKPDFFSGRGSNKNEPVFSRSDHLGFVAQEVEKVLPQLVSTNPTSGLKTVGYMGLIPVMVEGIKQQQQMIEKQQSSNQTIILQVNSLQKENEHLQQLLDEQARQIQSLQQQLDELKNRP